ncbi:MULTISPECIES: hypothetical protein [unclassified Synechocystis]|uniref:hypothetical protein n=1 Tax=unclassified Synechocystis TaxID=2640012 RepID=UPI0002D91FF6|nr:MULTISPECIES: hypothetical protein [unclassified Synechocystis]ALJ67591.1 hypothetical protein AOY38_06885 [Synechocystis sp. PCC 6803]AVP89433.1 hypothetical protein C7I86_06905 [Synechocystis sp. IPPAS B-1465]MBD2619518.1 hypothetical protein [Synechocystis sp. FACHB-898]MBD2639089.1 hypothetical protein [Synechocystis sp. FACHB-908]MBD2662188.1 hypothetical protein [Synechocystis sp. FACHB-929]
MKNFGKPGYSQQRLVKVQHFGQVLGPIATENQFKAHWDPPWAMSPEKLANSSSGLAHYR